ncbi:hypothetical protein MMC18_001744 [Xylographa bjoerkii]|nr:hypothetical protein [Xylographa bjoerkii]
MPHYRACSQLVLDRTLLSFSCTHIHLLRCAAIKNIARPHSSKAVQHPCDVESHLRVTENLRRHLSASGIITNICIVDTLRKEYPNHTVTQTPKSTGILELVKAGQASATLDTEVDFYATRVFKQADDQAKDAGHLRYKVEFGRYNYRWNDQDFWVYAAEYWEAYGSWVQNHYILGPRSQGDVINGQSQVADKLNVTGASLYPDWFPKWSLDYCHQHSAMIVTGDYRLMPESTGSDIMEDISDFWTWVREGLPRHLAEARPGIEADLGKVIAYGDSAGGTLAIQSGLIQPPGFVKAVIAAYPGLATVAAKPTTSVLGAPTIPPSVLEEFLRSMEPGKIVSSADPPARMPIALSIAQQGRKLEFWGEDERLFPVKVLQTVDEMPFVLVLHGKGDTSVPVEGSVRFAELVRRRFGVGKVDLRIRPGEHGFDAEARLDMPWLKEGLGRVTELWLG